MTLRPLGTDMVWRRGPHVTCIHNLDIHGYLRYVLLCCPSWNPSGFLTGQLARHRVRPTRCASGGLELVHWDRSQDFNRKALVKCSRINRGCFTVTGHGDHSNPGISLNTCLSNKGMTWDDHCPYGDFRPWHSRRIPCLLDPSGTFQDAGGRAAGKRVRLRHKMAV